MKTYTMLHMEAATCLWEAMLELRAYPSEEGDALHDLFDNFGTAEMRHTAISLADDVLKVWDAMTEDEQQKCIPYDWEFVPAFLSNVEFHNSGHYGITDHRAMAEKILAQL